MKDIYHNLTVQSDRASEVSCVADTRMLKAARIEKTVSLTAADSVNIVAAIVEKPMCMGVENIQNLKINSTSKTLVYPHRN